MIFTILYCFSKIVLFSFCLSFFFFLLHKDSWVHYSVNNLRPESFTVDKSAMLWQAPNPQPAATSHRSDPGPFFLCLSSLISLASKSVHHRLFLEPHSLLSVPLVDNISLCQGLPVSPAFPRAWAWFPHVTPLSGELVASFIHSLVHLVPTHFHANSFSVNFWIE